MYRYTEDIRVSVEHANAIAEEDIEVSCSPDVVASQGGSGAGAGWSTKKPPVPGTGGGVFNASVNAKDASFAAAVTARQHPNAHGALFASIGSPLAAAFPPSGMKHTPGKMIHGGGGRGGGMNNGGGDGGAGKVSGGKAHRKAVPSTVSTSRVMSPLPISRSVLERIDALGGGCTSFQMQLTP
jgi:hypothetical protein